MTEAKCVCSESILFRNPQVCASYVAGGWLAEKCCNCGHSRVCHLSTQRQDKEERV